MSTACFKPLVHSDFEHSTSLTCFSQEGSTATTKTTSNDQYDEKWYAHAQELDPRLGTLSYLPCEIRQMIFKDALSCQSVFSADGFWEYNHRLGSPLNVSAYYFHGCDRSMIDPHLGKLRQTSSSIKAEFDDALLSQRTFRFNDPESLVEFISQLDESQLSRVFSIAIGICLMYQVEDWLKAVAKLPSNLTDVEIRVYTVFNDYTQPASLNTLKDVMNEAARRVPNAKISVCGTGREPLTPECQSIIADFVQKQSQKARPR